MIVAPSVLSANFMHLADEIKDIEQGGAKWIHYDVMDGHFVPNISFGYSILKNIAKETDLFLDVHLMISDPKKYIPEFIASGAHLITFHYEACGNEAEVREVIEMIKKANCKVGISIKPFTPVEAIQPYLDQVDLVLVMSVEPGFGGQKFHPEVVSKIEQLNQNKTYLIEVDGGINQETGLICKQAGADVLVAGSYVFNSDHRKEKIESLL